VSKLDYETSRVMWPRSTRTVEPLMMMMVRQMRSLRAPDLANKQNDDVTQRYFMLNEQFRSSSDKIAIFFG
jgi:hypothetical protein